MGVTRRIIFPTIRLILWAVIAAALVKIAFAGADVSTVDTSLQPTGAVVEPTVEVSTATVTNAVTVQASVTADAAVVVRATLAGTVSKLLAADGAAVAAGTPILEIRQETPQDPIVKTDPETGEQTTTERRPKVTRRDGHRARRRHADAAHPQGPGGLRRRRGRQGRPRHAVGHRHPHARPAVPAGRRPTQASVTLTGGPAPFECTGLRVGAAPTTGTRAGRRRHRPSSSGTVTCAIPAGVTAFPGLGATIEITNGTAADAVVVPITAVQGTVQAGNVWVVAADGTQREARGGPGADRREERAGHRGPGGGRHASWSSSRCRAARASRSTAASTSTRWSATDEPPRAHRRHPVGPAARRPDAAHPAGRDRRGRRRRARRDRGPVRAPASRRCSTSSACSTRRPPAQYLLEGVPIGKLSNGARTRRRGRDFGFVFQQFNLLPGRTALENVSAPLLYARGRQFWSRTRLAAEMLERVGLGDRVDTMPDKLSGGEQQRVAIARALVRGPRVILADEPTGALDVETGGEVMDLLDEIASQTGAALVTITHDLAVAARAERQYRLAEGILVPISLDTTSEWVGDVPARRGPVVRTPSGACPTRGCPHDRRRRRDRRGLGRAADPQAPRPARPDRRGLRRHRDHRGHRAGLHAQPVVQGAGRAPVGPQRHAQRQRVAARRETRCRRAGWDDAFARMLERYDITYASRDEWTQAVMRFPDGTRQTQLRAVDADLGVINRIVPEQGRWFTEADDRGAGTDPRRQRGVPARVRPRDLSSHPTVELGDRAPVTATVIGVVHDDWPGAEPQAYVLYEQLHRWIGADGSGAQSGGSGPGVGGPDAGADAGDPAVGARRPVGRDRRDHRAGPAGGGPGLAGGRLGQPVRQRRARPGHASGSASGSAASRCCSAGSAWSTSPW